ncbi:MAG: hypothetical protein JSR82_23910 [Verrucomicrobia bacterium]|nr:hypothetical protein [Verrucomicrobiota bacterium]
MWLLVQNGVGRYDDLNHEISSLFRKDKAMMKAGEQVAVLIDSPGGQARCSYQIANMLRKHCGGFTAVVPQYAKSAATLLALGAKDIILGADAELGPLDAQFHDTGTEEVRSALDEVQSMERLFAVGLDAVDRTMQLIIQRTGKKVENVLGPTMHFVAEMMTPLVQKIDTVQFTLKSRILKVAEEYATRLLVPQYSPAKAKQLARHLVERYPEHGFVIDSREAASFGLSVKVADSAQSEIFERMIPFLNRTTVIGKIIEVPLKP